MKIPVLILLFSVVYMNMYAKDFNSFEIVYQRESFFDFGVDKVVNKFYNISKNDSLIEINSKVNKERVLRINSKSKSYFEFIMKKSHSELLNLIGEFEIKTYNTFISSITKFNDIRIENSVSSYSIIVIPNNIFFVQVKEGKIKVTRNSESFILIAGESILLENNKISLSNFPDYQTAKNVLYVKVNIEHKKNLSVLEKKIKTKKILFSANSLDRDFVEYLFLTSVTKGDFFDLNQFLN